MEPEGDSAKGRQVTSYGAEPALGGLKGYCQLYTGHQVPARGWSPPMGLSVTLCSKGKGPEKSLVGTKLSLREGLLVISSATLFGLLEKLSTFCRYFLCLTENMDFLVLRPSQSGCQQNQ